MKLTNTQNKIIDKARTSNFIKINAFAGTGKTTVLEHLTKKYSDSKFLYLVFNKSMSDEAKKRFPDNTHVYTINSLAYKYSRIELSFTSVKRGYRVIEIKNYLNIGKYDVALLTINIFNNFCNSSYMDINNNVVETLINQNEEYKLTFEKCKNISIITKHVLELWNNMYNGHMEITHNFYLKYFHINIDRLKEYINYDYVLLDECLIGDHYVHTKKGNKTIKSLYKDFINNKKLPLVKSYNIKEKIFEYKEILNAIKSNNRNIYLVESEGLNKIKGTSNHPILTQRGYVNIKDLIIGKDYILLENSKKQKSKKILNSDQYQILLGSYLGDGYISKQSNYSTYRLKFTHSKKQESYFKLKCNIFNIDKKYLIDSGYTKKKNILTSNYSSTFIINDFIENELVNIDARGLAIWYMDDGSINNNSISLHTNKFSYDENLKLKDILLNNFNLNCTISKNKNYYYLRLDVKNSKSFLKMIKTYMHPDLFYKNEYSNNDILYKWNNCFEIYGGNFIKSINIIGKDTVYDITVKDNHNFITSLSYYGTGIIVHNCQDTNDLTLDIFSGLKGKKIIVGDKHQAIFAWRGAINAMNKFNNNSIDECYLNETFRFDSNIAEKANFLLNTLLSEKEKIISYYPEKNNEIKTKCCITRTNSGIIKVFSKNYDKGKIIKTIRNPDDIFKLPLSLYYYMTDRVKYKDKITVKWLYNFRGKRDIEEYAKSINDIELLTSLNIVEEFYEDLIKIYNNAKAYRRKRKVDLFITTAHTCKGLEWDHVILYNDFPNIIQKISSICDDIEIFRTMINNSNNLKNKFMFQRVVEEINLYYVAVTRAIYKLDLDITNYDLFSLSEKSINNLLEEYQKN
jgi:hypothetical protein